MRSKVAGDTAGECTSVDVFDARPLRGSNSNDFNDQLARVIPYGVGNNIFPNCSHSRHTGRHSGMISTRRAGQQLMIGPKVLMSL